jgi:hypothetical protein
MLSAKPNSFMAAADAIPLDYESEHIAHFLETCTAQKPLNSEEYSFFHLRAFLRLVRELDCDRLIPSAKKSYSASYRENPLDWIWAASMDNDIKAAKAALLHCRETKYPLDVDAVFELSKEIRKSWRYPLIKCLKNDAWKKSKEAGMVHLAWPDRGRVAKFEEDLNGSE